MERVAANVELRHLGVADLDDLLVGPGIERAFDLEAGLGRGRGDQLDHGSPAFERPRAPRLGDVTEQAMLDSVPL